MIACVNNFLYHKSENLYSKFIKLYTNNVKKNNITLIDLTVQSKHWLMSSETNTNYN